MFERDRLAMPKFRAFAPLASRATRIGFLRHSPGDARILRWRERIIATQHHRPN